mmetsp:Transcript_1466/g.2281  ORF Transcript_1466/g.2281 Transcript_1466/m.2281 type:complete len:99 (-) Transcript_1466:37-333(-)
MAIKNVFLVMGGGKRNVVRRVGVLTVHYKIPRVGISDFTDQRNDFLRFRHSQTPSRQKAALDIDYEESRLCGWRPTIVCLTAGSEPNKNKKEEEKRAR